MKQIIFALLLLITSSAFAQQKKSNNIFSTQEPAKIMMRLIGDTLEILDITALKYVKIGDNIYEIQSPTLQKVEPNVFKGGGNLYLPFYNTDSGHNIQPFTMPVTRGL